MRNRLNKRHAVFAAGLAVIAAVGIGSPMDSGRASARVIATSVPFSVLTKSASSNPTVSGDGRMVVYTAAPGTADGRTSSVWITDRNDGSQVELTVPRDGVRLGNSVNPVISADGCVVVVTTEMAFDVFRDDDKGSRWDVYREVMPWCPGGKANDWALVSTVRGTEGLAQARGDVDPSQPAAVSSAGSVVAYVRPFESLSGIDDASAHRPGQIDVVDMTIPIDDPAHTTKAPGLPSDVPGGAVIHAGQRDPALTGDGSQLLFASDATSNEAVPDWVAPVAGSTTSLTQVFAWNRKEQDPFAAVKLISQASNGPANASAASPAVSADGRFVAFVSSASNLDPSVDMTWCGTACPTEVYVADRNADSATETGVVFDQPGGTSVSIVSAVDDGSGTHRVAGNGASFQPNMSSDGYTIVFASQSSNLMTVRTPGGGEATDGDLLIADVESKSLRRAFDSPAPAPAAHSHPHLSANGRVLVADSLVAKQLGQLPADADPNFVGRQVVAASYKPTLSIAALDMGTIVVSVPSQEYVINVVNLGPGSFVPDTVETDNPTVFTISQGSCLQHAPVRAGQSCSVDIVFTPDVAGPLASTLTIAEGGFQGITLKSTINGAGGDPALTVDPRGHDFPRTLVGTRAVEPEPAVFNVGNIYAGPAQITSVTFAGANPKDFAVTNNGCRAEVAVGSTCPLEVSFTPTAAGRRTATMSVSTAFGQYTSVFLSGDAYHAPQMIATASVKPGDIVMVGGTGFPANTGLVLGWSDGSGAQKLLTTDKNGGFADSLTVRQGFRAGPHTLIAQAVGGATATAPVDVERTAKRTAGSPTFANR